MQRRGERGDIQALVQDIKSFIPSRKCHAINKQTSYLSRGAIDIMLFGVQCVTNPRYRILNLFFPFSDRQASERKRQREREGREKYQMQWMTYTINERFCNLFHESIETQPKTLKEEEARKSFHFLESQKEYVYFLPLLFLFLSFFSVTLVQTEKSI